MSLSREVFIEAVRGRYSVLLQSFLLGDSLRVNAAYAVHMRFPSSPTPNSASICPTTPKLSAACSLPSWRQTEEYEWCGTTVCYFPLSELSQQTSYTSAIVEMCG